MTVIPVKVEIRYPANTGSFLDVTNFLRGFSINRGKGSETDDFESGSATVVLNNFEREFDPSFASSQFGGIVQPAGDIRISGNNIVLFRGKVYDWNLDFQSDGTSIASLSATDAFVDLAQREVSQVTPNEESASDRIKFILNRPEVNFSFDTNKISTAVATVAAEEIADGTRALDYLQLVTKSEPGRLFIDREGDLVFRSRLDSLFKTEFTSTRRNLSINPSFENNDNGWTGIFSLVTGNVFVGDSAAFLFDDTATQKFEASGSTTYTLSVHCQATGDNPTSFTLRLADTDDFSTFETRAEITQSLTPDSEASGPTAYTRLSVTGTTRPEAVEARLELQLVGGGLIDAILIEEATELRPWFDGDNAPADTDEETFVASWELG